LMAYLQHTRDFVADYVKNEISQIKVAKPEATYLMWLDCRELGLSDAALRDFFIRECKVGMNPGTVFGEGGSGYMRLNIGTRFDVVKSALESIKAQVDVIS
jgi:cystathionine beta-lyase